MKVTKTDFEGLLVVEPNVISDSRGHFYESFSKRQFENLGISLACAQENHSHSKKGVIRGLHFQRAPYAQTKLIRVIQGSILDVVVDLRRDQPTFMKVFTIELSADNKLQLLVPKGFAHGFSVLSEVAEVCYICDEYYSREHEAGIRCTDPALAIDWKVEEKDRIISTRDQGLPTLALATVD